MRFWKKLLLILLLFASNVYAQTQTFWQRQTTPDSLGTVRTILAHPNDTIFIGTIEGSIYSSADRGMNYKLSFLGNPRAKINGMSVNDRNYIFAAFDSSGVYRSMNNGGNWSLVSPLINATAIFTSPNGYVFAGTDNGEIYRTVTLGNTWELLGSTNYFKITSIVQNYNILYCGTMGGGVFRSSDLGNNWIQIVTSTPHVLNVQALHVNSREEIYATTSDNGLYKSSDFGESWISINNGISPSHYNVTSIISGLNDNIFIGTIGGGVYMSTNFGANWLSVTSGLSDTSGLYDMDIYSLAVDSLGFVYAGTSSNVFRTTTSATLKIPTLIAPYNNRDSISASPLMVWNSVPGAYFYSLQVSEDSNFSTLAFNRTGIIDTAFLVSGLSYETEYYWRIQAFSISGVSNWSLVWKFKTVLASPDIPNLLLPVNNDTTVIVTPTFVWNVSQRATRYHFQLSTTGDFSSLIVDNDIIVDTSYTIGALSLGTRYFWRVRAINISWMSDWSSIDSFRTIIPIPSFPDLISPRYSEEDVAIDRPLVWSKALYASGYHLQVSIDSLFRSYFFNDSTITDTIMYITMDNNKKYYWRVKSLNIVGSSSFSSVYHFITIVSNPIAPILIYPINGDTNVSPSPTFTWNNSGYRNYYQLQISDSSAFIYIINDTTWISDTTKKVLSLENSKQFYWRVRAKNITGISDWSSTETFMTYAKRFVPPGWSYISNTGNNSSISIPIHPTIEGIPISNGDAIGVFFLRNDSMFCGGYTIWDYNAQNGIIIWGNSAQTSIKDGFAQNELIRFRIWDSENDKEYPALVKLAAGKTSYFINEYLIVDSLKAATKIKHTINLNAGWNLISTYADPFISNMDSVCKDIKGSMILLKDGFGRFYWPDYDIYQVNNFEFRKGYQIYMLKPATLTFYGSNVLWDTTKINMIPGWNMISYLRHSPMRVDSALIRILNKVILVKNDAGEFFWNEFGVNTMGNMNSGIGYQVYMIDSATFTYPYSLIPLDVLSKKQLSNLIEPAKPEHFKMKKIASINTAILLFESNKLSDGDEVAVINSQGYLVGSASAVGNRAFITIFGDDEIVKDIEGAKQNEILYIKVFDNKTKKEYTVEKILVTNMISNKTSDNLYYITNGLLKAIEVSVNPSIPDKFSLQQNYPNPFNPSTTINFSLPVNSKVSIEVYNTLGQVVKKLINDSELNAGNHQVEFNADGLSTGIYFYKLKTESYSETKKMMLLK
jgi:photosystem II stability/assembly factor-like uncharacterized protein